MQQGDLTLFSPREDDINTVRDLIERGIITGLEWAGNEWTEALLPWGIEELRNEV